MRHRRTVPWLAAAVLAAVLSAAVPALTPGTAVAGPPLASSSPAAGVVVPAPPPVVTLRMAAPVARADAVVTDGCGRIVPGAVVVAGARVSIRLAVDHAGIRHEDHSRAGGAWRIDWRTVAADGNADTGRVPFTLAGEPRCTPEPAAPALSARTPAPGPPAPLLGALFAVAGAGVLLTCARLWSRRRAARTRP
jgi:methionine-rich copper-binding protein CopC